MSEGRTQLGDTAIWDDYWHCDRIASCFDGAGAANYDESLLAGWRDFFGALPQRCRILDLCTGNGAIALVAAEVGRAAGKGFDVAAIDRAAINPVAYVTRNRELLDSIRFQGGIAAEALPFADRAFDAVVSHYGLEYTDLSRSVLELARVAAAGARARLVVHAAEGRVAADAKRIIAEADLLLDAIALPEAARRCFSAVTEVERDPAAGEAERRRAGEAFAAFQAALQRLAETIPAAADAGMLRNCGAVLLDTYRRRSGLHRDQLLAKADEVESEIRAHRGRLAALVAAAVDEEGLDALAGYLRRGGAVDIERAPLLNAAGLIGHVLEARFV